MKKINYSKIVYDHDIIDIPVSDNGEPLIDLGELCAEKRISIKISLEEQSRKFFGKNLCLVRKTVGEKLISAQKRISQKGLSLVIIDAYRPAELQKLLVKNFTEKLRKEHPGWNEEKIKEESIKFVAPVEPGIITPHSTGGAVDITLEKNNKLLDMGTHWGELSDRSRTDALDISITGRKNRKILADLMHWAGFVNYPLEWWHWSIGDRTYAYYLKADSFYGEIKYKDVKWMTE